MSQYQQTKAESVLKRANELIQSEQLQLAIQELSSIVSNFNRKIKTWHEIYEEVMKKFIKVSVELRKGQELKNALSSYRGLCQSSEIKSFGNVVSLYLEQAEKRAQKAKEKSKNKTLTLEKDLESEMPENILLSEVSGEDIKDRTDREIVTPWLKFLWETYRQVLELLKKDGQLETIYHDTCQRAFKFCLVYKRKNEFKRLSEMLRTHVKSIDLTSPQGIHHYLDARFFQLSVAIDLELWQDAFKSVEDIYYLISASKTPIPPEMLLSYYDQLTKIFWNSKHFILHAYAYYKSFNLQKTVAGEDTDLQAAATRLLLSTLTIPPSENESETVPTDFNAVRNERRLVSLLGLSAPPNKSLLLSELESKQVTKLVYPELKDLYNILTVEFNPLKVCERMKPVFKFIESREELKNYLEPLKYTTVVNLLEKLSKVYQTVKIETVSKLADFVTLPQIEKIIVETVELGDLHIVIDHGRGVLEFNKTRTPFESKKIHSQLSELGKRIHEVVELIHPERKEEKEKRRKKLIMEIQKKLPEELKEISLRNEFIRMKKLWHEQEQKRLVEKAEEKKKELERQKELEEQKKQELEAKKREEEKKRREELIEEEKKKKEIIHQLTNGNPKQVQEMLKLANQSSKKKINNLLELDIDTLIDLKRTEIEKEKRDKERKLAEKSKSLDYLEITRRELEIPLLDDYNKKQQQLNKEAFDIHVNKQSTELQKEMNKFKEMRTKYEKYFEDKNSFINKVILEKRMEVYQAAKQDQLKRKQQQKAEWEAKRNAIKEEIDRIKKKEEEEKERKKKEREEQDRKLKEQAEIQRKKLEEMERKNKEEMEKKFAAKKEDKPAPFVANKTSYVPPHLRDNTTSSSFSKETKKEETTTKEDVFSAFGSKKKPMGRGTFTSSSSSSSSGGGAFSNKFSSGGRGRGRGEKKDEETGGRWR
ncbi:hypothetical protein ABK040_006742 [Willaertia magna]